MGDTVGWWSLRWSAGREVWVQDQAGSLSCVIGKNTLLSPCLSPPRRIRWIVICWGVTSWWLASHGGGGGVVILLVVSSEGNWEKLLLAGPLGSSTDLTFFLNDYNKYVCYPVKFQNNRILSLKFGVLGFLNTCSGTGESVTFLLQYGRYILSGCAN